MKRFYILIAVSFFVIAAVNKICLSEDKKGNISNSTQIVIEHDTAVNEENMTQAEWEERERNLADKALFEKKCGKCHSIDRPLSYKKTLKEWNATVDKMQKKDLTWILPAEAVTIADYLFKINGIKEKEEGIKPDTTFQLKKIK
ncbi:MAG: hypothetical protein PHX78_09450 [bacterium]|nr:hypothetical protein [bacterium]